jgi:hypothetical protein
MSQISVPYGFEPRDYQLPLWSALEAGCKRAVAVWHRRAGKDVLSLNWTVREAFRRPGLYWHILPTYNQGRKIVWNGMNREGRRFIDYFPPDTIIRSRDDEMTLWLEGGSIWQVIGTDDVDRLVGSNPIGCVFSEYSLQDPNAWAFLRPILAENGGWALFIYTPRGRNHGWRMLQMALEHEKWFAQVLSCGETGAIDDDAIEDERLAGMAEEMIQQEFYCSFDAPLVGSFYGDLLTTAHENGRIGRVPWEPKKPVVTGWDLGMADATGIWFAQEVGKEKRLIDYYEASGKGLDHYAKVLAEKPYAYSEHYVPHDAAVRELGTGKSRVEVAQDMGMRFTVVPRMAIADGINAVRMMLPQVWLDDKKCSTGLEALRQYVKERHEGAEGPEGKPFYRDKPRHNWTSHAADALRTLAVGWREAMDGEFQQPSASWVV